MNIIEAIKNRKEFERLTVKYQKTLQCHRWFAGWKDLDIIWKYILDDINFGGIETARKDYAKARNTDEYGTNSNGAVTITREDFDAAWRRALDVSENMQITTRHYLYELVVRELGL